MNLFRKKAPPPPTGPILRCSFCNKDQRYVKKLIAGPNVSICNECVDICLDILNAQPEPLSDTPAESAVRSNIVASCSICRLPFDLAKGLHIEGRGILCPACVQAIQAALAQ